LTTPADFVRHPSYLQEGSFRRVLQSSIITAEFVTVKLLTAKLIGL